MTEIQHIARLEVPAYERPPFQTTVKHLVVGKAIKHWMDTGEAVNFINRAGVKKFILEWAGYVRHHPFKRVATYVPAEVNAKVRHTLASMPERLSQAKTIELAEATARAHARSVVRRNPSLGKTLK